MNYEKMWRTLKAESGGRWCQPHPCSMELLTIGELMRNMERRATGGVEPNAPQQAKGATVIAGRVRNESTVVGVTEQPGIKN